MLFKITESIIYSGSDGKDTEECYVLKADSLEDAVSEFGYSDDEDEDGGDVEYSGRTATISNQDDSYGNDLTIIIEEIPQTVKEMQEALFNYIKKAKPDKLANLFIRI